MSVKRYDLSDACEGESGRCLATMVPAPDGDWVSFQDHAARIAELEAELSKARGNLNAYRVNLDATGKRLKKAEAELSKVRAEREQDIRRAFIDGGNLSRWVNPEPGKETYMDCVERLADAYLRQAAADTAQEPRPTAPEGEGAMRPIANGRLVEVGDIPVDDGSGTTNTYKCAAVIVFDSAEDLRKAIRHGAIEAKYRVGAPAGTEGNGDG